MASANQITANAVIDYVKKYKPSVVIMENVNGLAIKNKGAEPVMNHVSASFKRPVIMEAFLAIEAQDVRSWFS